MKYLFLFVLLIAAFVSHGQDATKSSTSPEINATNYPAEKCEALYTNWVEQVALGPGDGDGLSSWNTNTPLAQAWQEIYSNKIAMAYFMCDKIANSQYTNTDAIAPWGRLYEDVGLLVAVSGIELTWADDAPRFNQDLNKNMVQFTARFVGEWHAGIYKDPSKQVKQLCEERLSKETVPFIRELDLVNGSVAIWHYGIFGAPELIRQIKQHNSKHAFAAYLFVTGRRMEKDNYTDYLFFNDEEFLTAEDKITYIKKQFEEMKQRDGDNSEVMKKISAALSDSIPITAPKIIAKNPPTELLKTITDTNTGQYAVINIARDTVTLKDSSNRIIWSTNVIKGIENIGDEHWDSIREMQVIRDTLYVTEGHGNSAAINISTGELRYSNRTTVMRELGPQPVVVIETNAPPDLIGAIDPNTGSVLYYTNATSIDAVYVWPPVIDPKTGLPMPQIRTNR